MEQQALSNASSQLTVQATPEVEREALTSRLLKIEAGNVCDPKTTHIKEKADFTIQTESTGEFKCFHCFYCKSSLFLRT